MMNRKQHFWRSLLAVVTCVVMLSGAVSPLATAQDVQPTQDPAQLANDPTLPQETPAATETPAPPLQASPTPGTTQAPVRAQREDQALTPGAPATLAHGLAWYNGDDLVWQVEELKVPIIRNARSESSSPAIILQREGQTIIRNDVTGRRALLSPGESFFIAADDDYTVMSEDSSSVIWKFSLVDPDKVSRDAFYESPTIIAVKEGTYDLRLTRYVMRPGDTADLPTNSGAGLIMPGSGDVQVNHGGQLSILGVDNGLGQGQLLRQPTSISNTGSQPVVVFHAFLGEKVSDESAGEPIAATNNRNTSNTSSTGSAQQSNTTNSSSGDASSGTTTSPGQQPSGGPYLAQINIYAERELYLSVTVDGVLWFDGTLPQGSWTGPMNGTNFEVYTSSGAYTLFENACGLQFYMGNEPGAVTYTLTATRDSCPPPGN